MRPARPITTDTDDATLVDRARGGDRRAFDALVRRYAPRVFGLVRRWMKDRDEAEDVAQLAFVRAWNSLSQFQGGVEFRSWLFRIAVNAANDELRARKRHQPVRLEDVGEVELDTATGYAPDPSEAADTSELAGQMEAALAKLSEEHRAVLLLRAREEMSYEEISAALGIPIGTVMSRLARARTQLRALLKEVTP